jgi:hypothetical protein
VGACRLARAYVVEAIQGDSARMQVTGAFEWITILLCFSSEHASINSLIGQKNSIHAIATQGVHVPSE